MVWRIFPSSLRRGGCAIKKKLRSILSRADGVVINHKQILLEFTHHPVRSTKDASRYFIDIADAPPRKGGEKVAPTALIRHRNCENHYLVLGLIITLTFSCGLRRFPALVRRGCPRAAGLGRSVQSRKYRLIRSAARLSIRMLRDFEQTTP